MLRTIVPLFVLSVSAFGSQIHTISFTGVATEASGYDPYFHITQAGQTFTASIQFTHATWDGQSSFSVWNDCGGCADPYGLFDNGNGRVLQTVIGPQSGGLAGLMHIEFDAAGHLTLFDIGSINWGSAGVHWTPTSNAFSSGQPSGASAQIFSAGYITDFAYDGVGANTVAAATVPNPEPSSWVMIVSAGILIALSRRKKTC